MKKENFTRKRAKLWPAASDRASRELAAAALGVTRQAVEHWEYGRRKVPQSAVNLLACLEAQRLGG
jgi:DNA-binding transcriptional regulator YiaG